VSRSPAQFNPEKLAWLNQQYIKAAADERLAALVAPELAKRGVASPAQLEFIRDVATACGLVLDPVYSGKALFGLASMQDKPRRSLFIHTGGLPGLLADHARFDVLAKP
jgi:1-aminocyclopropane-1-carboxylate deaminase/D-cysteine desulfhydrase-like pyridoxal-dependent ACC family enzyme